MHQMQFSYFTRTHTQTSWITILHTTPNTHKHTLAFLCIACMWLLKLHVLYMYGCICYSFFFYSFNFIILLMRCCDDILRSSLFQFSFWFSLLLLLSSWQQKTEISLETQKVNWVRVMPSKLHQIEFSFEDLNLYIYLLFLSFCWDCNARRHVSCCCGCLFFIRQTYVEKLKQVICWQWLMDILSEEHLSKMHK